MNHWPKSPPPGADLAAMTGLADPALPVGLLASAAERQLADEAERALRAPRGRVAVVLHLSRLPPPGVRAHHVRVARAVLADVAQRHTGQIFTMRNSDLVLLCSAPAGTKPAISPFSLPPFLARLFNAEAARLTSLWPLDEAAPDLRRYIAQRHAAQGPAITPPEPATGDTSRTAALLDALATAPLWDMLSQQTAIQLLPGRGLPLAARLAPLFRELTVPITAVTLRGGMEEAVSDPFLFRHVAAQLDARLLTLLEQDISSSGRLTRPALRQNLPLYINLTVESIVCTPFSHLVQAAHRHGLRLGVEVALMDAAADQDRTEYARSLLDAAGFPLILDSVGATELPFTRLATLRPAFAKLTWSPALATLTAQADAAIADLGVERVILARADSEEALLWGQAAGITRFQGFFLDAVQAAARIAVCHSARSCTLRQCVTRAGTLNAGARSECGNPALLDTAPQGLGGARTSPPAA